MSALSQATLLITGGTGSFGSAVLRRLIPSDIREIRVFSRDEKKQDDMRKDLRSDKIKFFIGDVRDPGSLTGVMDGVDYIFAAAALKQVPSCEFFPMEAVKTNILGMENLLNAAISHEVRKVVCLSTDKAVYPINAMGISKAMMEKIFIAKSRMVDRPVICGTRYGNVMASRGSVIPLFINQIRCGAPITVTDPEMTRYMMTLDDAVDLVLFAFDHGRSGDIFVQKAPAVTIGDLARAICELLGVPDHPVQIIGTRHGEKHHEALLTREEMAQAEDLGGYYRIPADQRDLNYENYYSEGQCDISRDYTSENTPRLSLYETKALLSGLDCIRDAVEERRSP